MTVCKVHAEEMKPTQIVYDKADPKEILKILSSMSNLSQRSAWKVEKPDV